MRIALLLFSVIVMMFFVPLLSDDSFAHRSGCHRWHSCPSDSGSYGCGDLGYECRYSSTPSNSSSTTSGVEKQLGSGNILNDPYTGSAMDKARNILGTAANATANATGELMNRADNILSLASNTGSNATQEAMRKTMDLLTNVNPDVPNTMSSASTDETVLNVNEMANELINAASNASANATNATGTAIDQER
jgi:hypothetical protein